MPTTFGRSLTPWQSPFGAASCSSQQGTGACLSRARKAVRSRLFGRLHSARGGFGSQVSTLAANAARLKCCGNGTGSLRQARVDREWRERARSPGAACCALPSSAADRAARWRDSLRRQETKSLSRRSARTGPGARRKCQLARVLAPLRARDRPSVRRVAQPAALCRVCSAESGGSRGSSGWAVPALRS